MEPDDPVVQLDKIFRENLPQDWELSGCPDAILGVPEGTVLSLLRQINERKLWHSLSEVAKRHSDQWMLDLYEFFPDDEEEFIEPLVSFLLMAKTEHGKICFASSTEEWPWGVNTMYLLPRTIERVRQIREQIGGGHIMFRSLGLTINNLAEIEAKLHSANRG